MEISSFFTINIVQDKFLMKKLKQSALFVKILENVQEKVDEKDQKIQTVHTAESLDFLRHFMTVDTLTKTLKTKDRVRISLRRRIEIL